MQGVARRRVSARRPCAGSDATQLARPLAILEGAARGWAHKIIPLFGVLLADATHMAALVLQRPVAGGTAERRGSSGRRGRVVPPMAAPQGAMMAGRDLQERLRFCALRVGFFGEDGGSRAERVRGFE